MSDVYRIDAADLTVLFDLRHRHGATLLLITHNPELSRRCGRHIELVDGRILPVVHVILQQYSEVESHLGTVVCFTVFLHAGCVGRIL